ncbi:MAG: hypothetical protein EVA89_18330 [Sandaracinaceae bacterium]|nr:MAG: hypothetical protein EVA89_18330 [Sandaracinaceae bacterium]
MTPHVTMQGELRVEGRLAEVLAAPAQAEAYNASVRAEVTRRRKPYQRAAIGAVLGSVAMALALFAAGLAALALGARPGLSSVTALLAILVLFVGFGVGLVALIAGQLRVEAPTTRGVPEAAGVALVTLRALAPELDPKVKVRLYVDGRPFEAHAVAGEANTFQQTWLRMDARARDGTRLALAASVKVRRKQRTRQKRRGPRTKTKDRIRETLQVDLRPPAGRHLEPSLLAQLRGRPPSLGRVELVGLLARPDRVRFVLTTAQQLRVTRSQRGVSFQLGTRVTVPSLDAARLLGLVSAVYRSVAAHAAHAASAHGARA